MFVAVEPVVAVLVAVLAAVEDVLVLLVEVLPVDAVLLSDLIAFSMAEEPDWTALEPACLVVSMTVSSFAFRQKSSQSTNHTSAASKSTDTINHTIRPTTETLFCSYIIPTPLCFTFVR